MRKELVAFWKLIWNILWNCMIFTMIFPLAPERLTLGKVEKLTQNLRDKEKMVLHGEKPPTLSFPGNETEIGSKRVKISGEKFHEKLYRQKYFPEIPGEKRF